jgi:hypothetical protein
LKREKTSKTLVAYVATFLESKTYIIFIIP